MPGDLDRELLLVVTRQEWSKRTALVRRGATYCATIRPGDYGEGDTNVGMMPLHFAVRDGAPLARIKEIYKAFPVALISGERSGFTPLDLLNGLFECDQLAEFNYTATRANNVKRYLEAQLEEMGYGEAS